jgi:transcriptional regulator with PAS, ATPase and Fis domain
VIASTNKDLEEMIKTGEFREDLYYRLNVIPIYIPPLRDRKGDIAVLYSYFLSVLNKKLGKNIKGFTRDVEEVLLNHKWSGNVRELQNVVECAVNMARGEYITLSDIPIRISKEKMKSAEESLTILNKDEMMKKQISDALKLYGSDLAGKIATANVLGISKATLYRKIKAYNLDSKL